MTKHLIIVESPAKARTIQKFLNDDYKVMASMGHVRDLPSKKLGFDPENHFMPQYEIPKDKKKTITELKKAISKETSIYLATDEDREGESISWHLISALGLEKKPIQRIVFHEVTPGLLHERQCAESVSFPNPVQKSNAMIWTHLHGLRQLRGKCWFPWKSLFSVQ